MVWSLLMLERRRRVTRMIGESKLKIEEEKKKRTKISIKKSFKIRSHKMLLKREIYVREMSV